ncbi:unnamed protein product [Lactuca virosa]|uniref:Uncharacterized protein n=1 Tax=Lactuca virosa TaxID=75947 RepID=A0AAU9NEA3_9ASTR|nr:unnamed protein product [Lactuca virosa]
MPNNPFFLLSIVSITLNTSIYVGKPNHHQRRRLLHAPLVSIDFALICRPFSLLDSSWQSISSYSRVRTLQASDLTLNLNNGIRCSSIRYSITEIRQTCRFWVHEILGCRQSFGEERGGTGSMVVGGVTDNVYLSPEIVIVMKR